MKQLTFFAACLCFCWISSLQAQLSCDGARYWQPVFTCVDTLSDVSYGESRWNWRAEAFCTLNNGTNPPYNTLLPLKADIYQPCQDPSALRPLVIFIHGGAFSSGSKRDAYATEFCNFLAQRGYVAASIGYRLSLCDGGAGVLNTLTLVDQVNRNDAEVVRAAYRSIQDARAAVRYFKANAAMYRIDTSNIFVGGYSAGAVTAINMAWANDSSERPAQTYALPALGTRNMELLYPDMGGPDGEGGHTGYSARVKALLPVAGAAIDPELLDAGDPGAAILFHGDADDVVPFGAACFFEGLRSSGIITRCHQAYGSARIKARADSLGRSDVQLVTFPGASHDLSTSFSQIYTQSAAFLYAQVCGASVHIASDRQPTFRLFPNPGRDALQLELPEGNWTIQLLDATGRIVLQQQGREKSGHIGTGHLPAGIYTLNYQHAGGVESRRWVKL